MMITVRGFSTSAVQLKRIIPAVSTNVGESFKKSVSFEKNFPIHKRVKAWEKTGEDKETYFKRKHAHQHAQQLKWEEENGRARRGRHSKAKYERSLSSSSSNGDHIDRGKSGQEFVNDSDIAMKYKGGKQWKSEALSRFYDGDDEAPFDRFARGSRDYQYQDNYQDRKKIYSGIRPSPLSDFIYGSSAVFAALKANKRGYFTRLVIHNYKIEDERIIDLAKEMQIPIKEAKDKNELNILTNNGVHNGIVLETKPLLPQSIIELGKFENDEGKYQIGHDELGDLVEKHETTSNPFPLGIYLDEVSDPHNVGAIIRSAYFLGVDFVVLSSKNCSKITPTVVKTSSGASEFIPLYSTESPLKFLEKSSENGWKIVSSGQASHPKNQTIHQTLQKKALHFQDLDQLLTKSPVLLVVGSEGEGIRTTMKLRSDHIVEIESGDNTDEIIDSLNVSVASALMIKQLMSY